MIFYFIFIYILGCFRGFFLGLTLLAHASQSAQDERHVAAERAAVRVRLVDHHVPEPRTSKWVRMRYVRGVGGALSAFHGDWNGRSHDGDVIMVMS